MRGKPMRTNLVGLTLSIGASFVALGGCGGGAAEPVAEETTGAEDPTPRATFSGTWNGERIDARWAALGWQWPGGWTVFLSDRPPNEGDVGLPVDATYVELRFGDALEPTATEPGHTMTPFVTVAPNPDGSTTPYEGEGSATVGLSAVTMSTAYDPSGSTPQTVGTATLDLDATFPADASHAAGNLRGQGEIPIVFLGAPHAGCRDVQPAPTDYTWAEEPNLRHVPSGPVHGNVRGRAFSPASLLRASHDEQRRGVVDDPLHRAHDRLARGRARDAHAALRSRAATRTRDPRDGLGRRLLAGLRGPRHHELERRQRVRARDHALAGGRCTPGEAGQPAHLGTASGRMIVVYRGYEESENSWVAGTFTNVPIVAPSCE
ncbi:MAG: hypothetical protein U0353_23365 [Sandaracinus sp.]